GSPVRAVGAIRVRPARHPGPGLHEDLQRALEAVTRHGGPRRSGWRWQMAFSTVRGPVRWAAVPALILGLATAGAAPAGAAGGPGPARPAGLAHIPGAVPAPGLARPAFPAGVWRPADGPGSWAPLQAPAVSPAAH